MKAQAPLIRKTPTPSATPVPEGEVHTEQDSVQAEYQEEVQAAETQVATTLR
jgi:hypothetical protein